jgi:hypothetical protein
MPDNIKALIVVLVLAVPAFYLGRRLAASVISPREFAVWRNVWFAATMAAFLSGDFFVFAAIMVMICFYARAVGASTAALFFVLLFVAPLPNVPIGGFGLFNLLFVINNARLLEIVLLLPIMFAMGRLGPRNGGIYLMPDRLIVGYVLLRIGLEIQRTEVTTQFLRSAMLLTVDVLIPYFVFSRAVTSAADFRKVLLAFVIALLPLSLIAVFEAAKGWLLYSSITNKWAPYEIVGYGLQREGILRATASAASPIVLGFTIMVAIGCGLALRQTIGSRRFAGIALAIFGAGLVGTLSRGPWVGAMVLVLMYLATSPNAVANLAKFVVIGATVLLPLLLTSFGSRLLDLLPFIGTVDATSYRERLFDNAILVIERNLWFGSSDYLLTPEMQKMIQGEHIIDIVNSYLKIALDSGLVGLGLFLSFFAAVLIGLWRVVKFRAVQDIGLGPYARASMATLIAILVTIATVSSIDFISYVYWSFAGLCVALIRIAYRERAAVARAAHASRVPA